MTHVFKMINQDKKFQNMRPFFTMIQGLIKIDNHNTEHVFTDPFWGR